MSAWLVAAVVAGCGQPGPRDRSNVDAVLDPSDERISAFVAWLQTEGIRLESTKTAEGVGWWRVAEPKISDEYDVVFSIRAFPSWASAEQMRDALDISLAHMLNAEAHLAMSYGGFQGKHADAKLPRSEDELPRVNGLPVTKAVEHLFKQYKRG